MGVYLLGKLQLTHDSPIEKLSVTRLLLSICTFTFVVYMIPGMFGAPLKALSGYLPPMTTQDFDINRLIREQQTSIGNGVVVDENFPSNPRFSSFLHLPHGINGFYDYDEDKTIYPNEKDEDPGVSTFEDTLDSQRRLNDYMQFVFKKRNITT